MSETASTASGIAGRYAQAVFDLAKESSSIKTIETDVAALGAALDESADLRALIVSPVYTREDQAKAVAAVASKMKLSPVMTNGLAVLAAKRRLFVLPQFLAELRDRIAAEKDEVTVDVTAASALTKAQADKLAASLKASVGKTIKLNTTVDESLIGGLIVKVGSKMIDTSIRSKLASLQNAMKEVG